MSDVQVESRAGATANGDDPDPQPRSLLDEVRAQLERDTAEETLDLRLPRKTPRLVVRYRVITDPDEVDSSKDAIAANVSMLSIACVGLFALDKDGKLRPLEKDGRPVTYATVGEALGLGTETARETVLRLFKDNQIAFMEHADRVATWMSDTSREVEGEVLGESSA